MYDHKKRTAEMIAVMQAYVDGKPIEVSYCDGGAWSPSTEPIWNWRFREYRIATIPDSINWDHVAPEWKWMARDKSGVVYFFKNEPKSGDRDSEIWSAAGGHMEARGFASYTRGTVDWQQSIVRRPV